MRVQLHAGLVGLSLIAFAAPAVAAPSAPAAPSPIIVAGIGVVNAGAAIQASKAYIAVESERQTTFKKQLDAAEGLRQQINAQLQPLIEKFNRDRQAGNVSQSSLQAQATAIQNIQQSAQKELQAILAPVARSDTYVQEQFSAIINNAISNAMAKRGITLVVPQQNGLFYNNKYNLDAEVADQLNVLLPAVKLIPPNDWQPRVQH